MNGRVATSSASASGSSSGLSQTPTSPRASSAVALGLPQGERHDDRHGLPAARRALSPSRSSVQRSSTMAPSLMSCGIDALLEGLDAEPAHGVDEALVLVPARRRRRRSAARPRRASRCAANDGPITLPSEASFALRAADRDLVPLLAVLVDAEHADVADVMMAAGVHAAGDVEVELADVVQVVEVVEAALDRFGDRDRLGVGERAEVAARAADDVGEQADVRRGEAERLQLAPEREQLGLPARRRRSGSARARRAARRSCSASASSAIASIWSEVASPGGTPVFLSDSVTIA